MDAYIYNNLQSTDMSFIVGHEPLYYGHVNKYLSNKDMDQSKLGNRRISVNNGFLNTKSTWTWYE